MTDTLAIYALINPVRGFSAEAQRALIAKRFSPFEWFTVGVDGDFDDLRKLLRPGRMWAVAAPGLMAEQVGNKEHRVETMIALKVDAAKKESVFIDATGLRSDRDWPAMRSVGAEMCRRLAQGQSSALNGTRGAKPYIPTDAEMLVLREEWFVAEGRTVEDAVRVIQKRLKKRSPRRSLLYKLLNAPPRRGRR